MSKLESSGADVVELPPWELTLRRADRRSAVSSLLEGKDALERVQGLASLEAYQVVKALGPADAAPLLALLSPVQSRALLDLDVWHGQELEIPDLLIWFEAFRAAGPAALVKAARALDPEALALVLRRRLLIAFKPKDDVSDQDPVPDWVSAPSDALAPLVETEDRRFIIAARLEDPWLDDAPVDEEERKAVLQLVDELYKDEDWEWAATMMRSAMADMSSSLHEDALRFRDGRMEDLGFPPLMRALEVYGPLEASAMRAGEAQVYPTLPEVLPAVYTAPLATGLFDAAMRELDDPELVRRIEGDLVPLANAALVADGAEPGAIEHLQDTLSRARGYIELALAFETPAGPARLETAVARLRATHVTSLFRVGYTLTLKAATRARALAANDAFEQDGLPLMRLEEAERAALDGLRAKRPRVSLTLEPTVRAVQAGRSDLELDPTDLEGTRAFLAPEDLEAVHRVLDDLEALAAGLTDRADALAAASAAPASVPPEERTAQVFVTTAVARALLGLEAGLAPMTAAEVADLADRLTLVEGAGRFDPEAAADAVAEVAGWFEAGAEAVVRRAARGVGALEQALWPLMGAEVDPRFVSTLLVSPA